METAAPDRRRGVGLVFIDSAGSAIPSLDVNFPGTGIPEAAREAFSEATRFSAYAAAGFLTLGLLATVSLTPRSRTLRRR